jgi:hypothetical protein
VIFQLATKTDLLKAATASGGGLVDYFIDHEAEGDNRSTK